VARATLDITPDLLPLIPALLPRGVNVFGSEALGGAVRLILEGENLPEGRLLQMVVVDEPLRRVIELKDG
jgi:hypothetical protein